MKRYFKKLQETYGEQWWIKTLSILSNCNSILTAGSTTWNLAMKMILWLWVLLVNSSWWNFAVFAFCIGDASSDLVQQMVDALPQNLQGYLHGFCANAKLNDIMLISWKKWLMWGITTFLGKVFRFRFGTCRGAPGSTRCLWQMQSQRMPQHGSRRFTIHRRPTIQKCTLFWSNHLDPGCLNCHVGPPYWHSAAWLPFGPHVSKELWSLDILKGSQRKYGDPSNLWDWLRYVEASFKFPRNHWNYPTGLWFFESLLRLYVYIIYN